MIAIDLNSDLGEGFGRYRLGDDRAIIPLVSSASVACGFHAGDPRVIDDTVARCRDAGVAVGAHVGYPDLVGFGRRNLEVSDRELETDVMYQLGALAAFCHAHGVRLQHVKPHGALYNRAAVCSRTSEAIVRAVSRVNSELLVFAPPGSRLIEAARSLGLRTVAEGFCDRAYRRDGSLAPRGEPGAVLTDPREVAERAVALAVGRAVPAADGGEIRQAVESLCVHGDSEDAALLLAGVRQALAEAGIRVAAPAGR